MQREAGNTYLGIHQRNRRLVRDGVERSIFDKESFEKVRWSQWKSSPEERRLERCECEAAGTQGGNED